MGYMLSSVSKITRTHTGDKPCFAQERNSVESNEFLFASNKPIKLL